MKTSLGFRPARIGAALRRAAAKATGTGRRLDRWLTGAARLPTAQGLRDEGNRALPKPCQELTALNLKPQPQG